MPIAVRKVLQSLGEVFYDSKLVPCCRECNCLLGSSWDSSLLARKRRLRVRLRHKYKELLDSGDWRENELSELGYSLRTHITESMKKREEVIRRLKWHSQKDGTKVNTRLSVSPVRYNSFRTIPNKNTAPVRVESLHIENELKVEPKLKGYIVIRTKR